MEVQRYVAESSGWDPPMYMELSPSLVFRVTLTRPRPLQVPVCTSVRHRKLEGKLQVKLALSPS